MKVRSWWSYFVLLILSAGGCGEQAGLLGDQEDGGDASSTRALVQQVRGRFKALAPQFDRAMTIERARQGFRFIPPAPATSHTPGAWHRPSNHRLVADFPARASGVARFSNGPVAVEVSALGVRDVPGVIADGALVYRGAYQAADTFYLAEADRVEELVLLDSVRAPRRFEYRVKVVAGGGRVRQSGAVVEALDAGGTAWLRMVRPFVIDGEGRRHAVPTRIHGQRLLLQLPDEARRYPMLLDPGWTTTGNMAEGRSRVTATQLHGGEVLVTGGKAASTELYDPASGTWTLTGSLPSSRSWHTATLLPSGKVLVCGGSSGSKYVVEAYLYDASTGKWTATGSMNYLHSDHTAILLATGDVLVTGGLPKGFSYTSELYNPTSGTWSKTGSLFPGRYGHRAVRLASGKVIVAGGKNAATYGLLARSDLFDPASGKWTWAGNMSLPRVDFSLSLLSTGDVLAAGGYVGSNTTTDSADLFKAATGTWTATGKMTKPKNDHSATLLGSGKVLTAGGFSSGSYQDSTDLYYPSTGKWLAGPSMVTKRGVPTARLLRSGKVLVVGGGTTSAELYDPFPGKWSSTGAIHDQRYDHSATLLPSGEVLVAGGFRSGKLKSAELYDPKTGAWTLTGSLSLGRGSHAAALMTNGKVLVTGGGTWLELYDPSSGKWSMNTAQKTTVYFSTATVLKDSTVLVVAAGASSTGKYVTGIYDPNGGTWTPVPTPVHRRSIHSASLLASGKVLVAGGVDHLSPFAVALDSSELFDPATKKWSVSGTMTAKRYHHTATILGSGKVLVAGGMTGPVQSYHSSAELYDPATGKWTKTGSMKEARCRHSATAVGQVLVAGGHAVGVNKIKSVELYDEKSGTFARAGEMLVGRWGHTATLLGSGKILIVGGSGGKQAELYDPAAYLACQTAAQCASGHCVDGICCGSACLGRCKACRSLVSAKGITTVCGDVAQGQVDPLASTPCVGGEACDGKGTCLKANSRVCSLASECASGHCMDGRCCGSACAETCKSCAVSGSLGACSELPVGSPDTNASTTCTGANACDGKGACKKDNGQACTAAAECAVGLCVDGWCCKSACTGTCMSCAVGGNVGQCVDVPAGHQDSYAATAPCTGANACDGKGACKVANGQTCTGAGACGSGHCVEGTCCESACAAACKSCAFPGKRGTCVDLPAGSADNTPAGACAGSKACDGQGGCRAANGQNCGAASQCGSGFCVDGTCCGSACAMVCTSCSLSGSPGACSNIPAGQQDSNATVPCTGAGACDGQGACKKAAGQSCSAAAQCGTGLCVDGTCCDSACTATCKSCSVAGSLGSCTNIPAGQQDSNAATTCSGTQACNGSGTCKSGVGQACLDNSGCANNTCVDKVCCKTACDKTCESCAIKGTQGTCSPIAKGVDPDGECIGTDPKCGGSCDGARQCDFPTIGTACGSCKACDGTGKCSATPKDDTICGVIDCDMLDTPCRDYADISADRCDSFGSCKKPNDLATCKVFKELQCDAGPDSSKPDMGPAKMEAGPGIEVGTKPPGGSDSSGCSLAGGSRRRPLPVWPLLLLAMLLRRRR